jgi:hypothetical protein
MYTFQDCCRLSRVENFRFCPFWLFARSDGALGDQNDDFNQWRFYYRASGLFLSRNSL